MFSCVPMHEYVWLAGRLRPVFCALPQGTQVKAILVHESRRDAPFCTQRADFFLINSSPDTTSTSNQPTHPFTVKQGQSSGHSHLPHLFGNQSLCKLCCFAFLSRYNSFFGAFSEIVRKTFSHNLICTWKDNMAYFTLPVPVCCYCSNVQNRRTALITTVDGAQSVIQTSCRSITQVH